MAATDDDIECTPGAVCRQKETLLPLRVLTRSFSKLYNDPDDSKDPAYSNVTAFTPLYVFERKGLDLSDPAHPKGWYKIGATVKTPWLWLPAKDALEWKQAIVVAYTHPGEGKDRRHPVLMFKTKENLRQVAEAKDGGAKAKAIYDGLDQKPPKVAPEIIAREPSNYVSIDNNKSFYLLPVVAFEKATIPGNLEPLYLQIAAATPGHRGFKNCVNDESTCASGNLTLSEVNVKFVMDMTYSMQPYIDQTKEVIQQITLKLAQEGSKTQDRSGVKYGLIGYRDNVSLIPGLEFTIKNFTPELMDEKSFINVLGTAQAAQVGSGGYPEDVLAGVKEAIESKWNQNALRVLVLVGDASAHEAGEPFSTTRLNVNDIRTLADSNQVYVLAIHLKDLSRPTTPPEIINDHPIAAKQFTALATNKGQPGQQSAFYRSVNLPDTQKSFEQVVKEVVGGITQKMGNKIDDEPISPMVNSLFELAMVEYLGKESAPPTDFTAWVMDRDLIDPPNRSLEPRVLLKKSELSDLAQAMDYIHQAWTQSKVVSMNFFDSLRSVLAGAVKEGGKKISYEAGKDLTESGLLPKWLESLPYRSELLEMTPKRFEELTADERNKIGDSIVSKVELYKQFNEDTGKWVALDPEHDAKEEYVYPVPLKAFP